MSGRRSATRNFAIKDGDISYRAPSKPGTLQEGKSVEGYKSAKPASEGTRGRAPKRGQECRGAATG